jgi:hypothetical protein
MFGFRQSALPARLRPARRDKNGGVTHAAHWFIVDDGRQFGNRCNVWLTRSEAARLLRAAWRHREVQQGQPTVKYCRRHLAPFIIVALYTGSRAAVVAQAAL